MGTGIQARKIIDYLIIQSHSQWNKHTGQSGLQWYIGGGVWNIPRHTQEKYFML